MRLSITLLILSLSTFGFCEDAPGVDLSKVPEIVALDKAFEKGLAEYKIKAIKDQIKKLEPLVKKYASKEIKVGALIQGKIDSLEKEGKELSESLSEKPTGLMIVKATFGVPTKKFDVTNGVKKLVKDDSLVTVVNGTIFGAPDPAPGVKKSVVIEYILNGKTCTFKGIDGEQINISASKN